MDPGSPTRRRTKSNRATYSPVRRDFRLPTSVFRLLLAALLDVVLHELFGVLFENRVDLVQEIVQFLQIGLRFGVGQLQLFDFFFVSVSLSSAFAFLIRHGQSPSLWINSEASATSSSIGPTRSRLPRSGSSIGTRRRCGSPRSKTRESQLAATRLSGNWVTHLPRKYARVSSGGWVSARAISSSVNRRRISLRPTRRW